VHVGLYACMHMWTFDKKRKLNYTLLILFWGLVRKGIYNASFVGSLLSALVTTVHI